MRRTVIKYQIHASMQLKQNVCVYIYTCSSVINSLRKYANINTI